MAERAIKRAYAAYDSDPRVGGPDDRDAFMDAVTPLMPDRAIIAISDDREWLVALDRQPAPYNGRIHFGIYAWHSGEIAYTSFDFVPDTGQSAEEVLANYLASRKK